MLKGDPAVKICGFVEDHAEAFSTVAASEKVVIVSRAANQLSTGLLAENYAAKGFHIKGKSCDFGPMAGFVCVESNFSKKGTAGAKSQQAANDAQSFKSIASWVTYTNGTLVETSAALSGEPGIRIYGLTNSVGVEAFGPQPKNCKAAVAGDYDLFCICPELGTQGPQWTERPMRQPDEQRHAR